VLALLAGGCASPAPGPADPGPSATGTVVGSVTWAPSCPVEGPSPCAPQPAANIPLHFAGDTAVLATTDSAGRFHASLRPGTYRVSLAPGREEITKDLPASISVAADRESRLDIRLDSLIR
jgi:hypothetical protein